MSDELEQSKDKLSQDKDAYMDEVRRNQDLQKRYFSHLNGCYFWVSVSIAIRTCGCKCQLLIRWTISMWQGLYHVSRAAANDGVVWLHNGPVHAKACAWHSYTIMCAHAPCMHSCTAGLASYGTYEILAPCLARSFTSCF
jgi:hypothetical protein